MKKNETLNYKWHRGTLHTFGDNGNVISNKKIYYRYVVDSEGNDKVKEILTGEEYPTATGMLLHYYSNVKNFVTWSADVSPKEIERYLKKILSDEELFHKEVEEILFPKTIVMKREKKLKM